LNEQQSSHPNRTAGRLDGQTVVIFGGTSGIGLATAIQAKEKGAKVIVIGLRGEIAKIISEAHGFDGWRSADVANDASVVAAVADIDHADHLVLLAGSFVVGKILETDVSVLKRAFDERVWGAISVLRSFGTKLSATGSVTFISGVLADRPTATGTAVLASASAAMEALARGLALELSPLRVNTLSPGTIDTPLLAKVLGDYRDTYVEAASEKSPVKRIGTPEEAASAVVFLMTNGFVSGETLHVDGGQRLV
jgi:NAD(P)-dependent dehydrogenase (short-subunit alcohol dehydrogenase family)